MQGIDTHCHIYLTEFDGDREQMIERAGKEGVSCMLMPAIDSSTHPAMLETEKAFSASSAMMGLHPCSVKENYEEELRIAQDWLDKRKFVAIGETGLDFYWDLSFVEQQYKAFGRQAEWARDLQLPLVIHSRNSLDDCIRVVSEMQDGRLRGVFHCFSGTAEQARQVMGLGFYLGIGGVVTFKNSGLDGVIKDIGLELVVLETDSPYLAPVPYRGKRNECAYLSLVAEKIASVRGMDVDKVREITTSNAKLLFGLQ